jgi:hypothetical protein
MSMILCFATVSDQTIGRLRAHPKQVEQIISHEEDWAEGEEGNPFDLDKAWHAIHFMLTGSAWEGQPPLNFLLQGESLEGFDTGYGPARYYTGETVQEIAIALGPLTWDAIKSRYDHSRFEAEEIYPQIWDRPAEEEMDYFEYHYNQLRTYVQSAARKNLGLLIWIG